MPQPDPAMCTAWSQPILIPLQPCLLLMAFWPSQIVSLSHCVALSQSQTLPNLTQGADNSTIYLPAAVGNVGHNTHSGLNVPLDIPLEMLGALPLKTACLSSRCSSRYLQNDPTEIPLILEGFLPQRWPAEISSRVGLKGVTRGSTMVNFFFGIVPRLGMLKWF